MINKEIVKITKAIEKLKAYEDFQIHMIDVEYEKGTLEYLGELIAYAELTLDSGDEVSPRSLKALEKKVQEARILQKELECELQENKVVEEVATSSGDSEVKSDTEIETIVALQYIKNHIEQYGYVSGIKGIEQNRMSTKEIIKIETDAETEFPEVIDNNLHTDMELFKANCNVEIDYHKFLIGLISNKYIEIDKINSLVGFFPSVNIIEKRILNQTKTFLGEVGDKLELEAIYDRKLTFDGFVYGTNSYIYFFKSLDGNTLTWKTSKEIELDYNSKVKIKGTVKDCVIYNGEKQTVLTRCKIESVEEV